MQVTRNNHFVSQWYLKNWAAGTNSLWVYQLLVPQDSFPLWEHRPVRGIAFRRDLYTSLQEEQDCDDIERWLEAEIEAPVRDAVERATNGRILTPDDFKRLALFALAQDMRTPQDFVENKEWLSKEFPVLFQHVVEEYKEHAITGQQLSNIDNGLGNNYFQDDFKIHARLDAYPETQEGEIEGKVLAGRKIWLERLRYLLTHSTRVRKAALTHCWSIAEPVDQAEWFTSDHPVVRLNYHSEGNFDVRGGWGNNGGIICMPLSPKHLLYTQIGMKLPPRVSLSMRSTLDIRRAIAARAHRMIFAREPIQIIEKIRARVIDPIAFHSEGEAWKDWHTDQNRAQKYFDFSVNS
ncbi:MAG: DUF4238 domain-containing protein [Armatimonadota bacterium]